MKYFWLIAVLAAPVVTAAADESPDVSFYRKATEGGLAEVDGGMLAIKMAKSPAVVRFGEMMVKDHTAADNTLRGLAAVNHVELPAVLPPEQAQKKSELQKLAGDAFDKSYIEWQILAHKDAIALFKEESASGDDIDAKRFATESLPMLQSHLAALLALPVVTPAAGSPQ